MWPCVKFCRRYTNLSSITTQHLSLIIIFSLLEVQGQELTTECFIVVITVIITPASNTKVISRWLAWTNVHSSSMQGLGLSVPLSGMDFILLEHSLVIYLLKVKFHQPCFLIKGHSVTSSGCVYVCCRELDGEGGVHSCNYYLCVFVYMKAGTVLTRGSELASTETRARGDDVMSYYTHCTASKKRGGCSVLHPAHCCMWVITFTEAWPIWRGEHIQTWLQCGNIHVIQKRISLKNLQGFRLTVNSGFTKVTAVKERI